MRGDLDDHSAFATELSAAVAARILHDMSNPLGAVGNGVELLQLTADAGLGSSGAGANGQSEEIALIAASMRSASYRMRLLRLAFGTAQPGQMVAPGDLSEALLAPARITARWPVPAQGLARWRARLGLLALMCLESALPRGGSVEISDNAQTLVLDAHSDGAPRLPSELWQPLALGELPQDHSPGVIHFTLLAQHARNCGTNIRAELPLTAQTPGALRVTLHLPPG